MLCCTFKLDVGKRSILDFLWSRIKLAVWLPALIFPITWARNVWKYKARAFSIFTFQDLSNHTMNTPMQGVLGLAIELWTFGSHRGLQIPYFSKCWASPPTLGQSGVATAIVNQHLKMLHALTMWPMQNITQIAKSFYPEFWAFDFTSLILPRGAQTSTFLYAFSTFQPSHTKKQGYGKLLVLFVLQ